MKEFFQSHRCGEFQAEVHIRWTWPKDVEISPERLGNAEIIAEEMLAAVGPKTFDMVQVMRGLPELASPSKQIKGA